MKNRINLAQIVVTLVLIVSIIVKNDQFMVNASPQLDLPVDNNITSIRKISFDDHKRTQTNGHADKPVDSANSGDQSNEVSVGDTPFFDRDRSQRFGPPYSDENDRRYYNDDRNSRFNNRNYGNRDDDDKYYTQPRPNDDYYISERQRSNRYGYRDYYSINNGNYNGNYNGNFNGNLNRNPYDDRINSRYPYTDREPYNPRNPYDNRNYDDRNRYNDNRYNDNRYNDNRPNYPNDPNNPNNPNYPNNINNPNYPNNINPNFPNNPNFPRYNDEFDDRNRYTNRDYEQHRLELERENRLKDANLRRILGDVDKLASAECSLNVGAQWNFETNVNEATQQESIQAQQRFSEFQRELWEKIQTIDRYEIFDDKLYRQVKFMSIIGPNALPPDQFDRYNRLINDMLAIYNKAQICGFDKPFDCGLKLYPDLKNIMANGRDWDELLYVWGEWRRKSGENMKELYEQLVDVTNLAANYNNFSNAAEYWTFPFESYNIRQELENVWTEVLPLYELIHAYVRRRLREYYGPNRISRNAPLPAHILGNMYGQSWSNILDLTVPFPGRSFIDVTREMHEQGYTPQIMFQIAEEFFLSINLTALPTDFWLESVMEKPPVPERQLLCQPSSWDFCNQNTYRIKMCTSVNQKDLITVHHEMMHVQYFLQYRHQPKVFRDGANPAFHDALGDTIALSVSTPKHLQTLGLIQRPVDDTAHDINFLFTLAMDKVVFLPFALAMDVWRWDVFNKDVNADHYNCHWWLLRERYGGIKPPVLRSEMDFDPAAKFHIPANIPYIRYFFATILQFQIHRAICKAALQYDPNDVNKPLHKCDIYRQPVAGNILKQIMEKGASQRWQELLQEVIGEGRLDGTALREYFRPLKEWLRQENLRNNEFVGWVYDGDYCKHSIDTANLQVYGGFYNYASHMQPTDWTILLCVALLIHIARV